MVMLQSCDSHVMVMWHSCDSHVYHLFWLCHVKTDGSGSIEDEILKLQASGKSVPEAKKKELISDLQVRQSHLHKYMHTKCQYLLICTTI